MSLNTRALAWYYLHPRITGTLECESFKIEKVIYESRPGSYITANLYLPKGISFPSAAVLFLCGHSDEGKQFEKYQAVCQYLVHAGLVVLAQDPVGQGERFSYYEEAVDAATVWHCVAEHEYAGCQSLLLGDSITRYFIHDAMRSIDYLLTRPEVDHGRIGVTGASGGGTQTTLLMICDKRIAAAAPTNFFMNRREYMLAGGAQDQEQIWPGMTACGFDHEDILLLMAPKPVQINSVRWDYFPVEGARRNVSRARRFWEMYGKKDNLAMVEDDSVHSFTRFLCKKTVEFFAKHLLECKVCPDDSLIKSLEPARLWCTTSGIVKKEYGDAVFVHDENCRRLEVIEKEREDLAETKKRERAEAWLREKVFCGRKECGLNPRLIAQEQFEDFTVEQCIWWSQKGLFSHALIIKSIYRLKGILPVTLALWDGGTQEAHRYIGWIRKECTSGRAVVVLDVSGEGILKPNAVNSRGLVDLWGTMHKLADDLIWLNDSIAAIRTYDVIRALDMVEQWHGLNGKDINLYCNGRYGIYGKLAALLDRRVTDITERDGVESLAGIVSAKYYDQYDIKSIIIPGILRYFDLPELDRWIGCRY